MLHPSFFWAKLNQRTHLSPPQKKLETIVSIALQTIYLKQFFATIVKFYNAVQLYKFTFFHFELQIIISSLSRKKKYPLKSFLGISYYDMDFWKMIDGSRWRWLDEGPSFSSFWISKKCLGWANGFDGSMTFRHLSVWLFLLYDFIFLLLQQCLPL
jgi:hypothetical protein